MIESQLISPYNITIVMTLVIINKECMNMHSVSKGVLKAKMLEYFRQVEKTREELIVTDHNKPVLRILPYQTRKLPTEIFKQGKVLYFENINTPTSSEWNDV